MQASPADSRSDATAIAQSIKGEAARLGFDLCGITSADPPPHHREYRKWLGEGKAGEMLYLHRQEPRRGDLSAVLPGARSVVCVAMNYSPQTGGMLLSEEACPDASAKPLTGVVARYARFDDYHDLIWTRLEQLLSFIQALAPGANGKVYCDTGPITERDLAMRAGVGWIGKHTNLISRRLGNWFFLGEIVVDIDLPPDTPETGHCGTCTRCIPACPTGAITAPYELDARRCIAYLTIELKGSIPVDLRPLIGTRIFGCDDCLAVCPWNKFAQRTNEAALQARTHLSAPDLIDLLSLDEAGFKERFASSPILRTKRRGLLRNVCVALGNLGDRRAIPALRKAIQDCEPLVGEHAAWALEQIERRF